MLIDAHIPWRPVYLRRVVLLGFIVVFIAILIAVEGLFAASNSNSGITSSSASQHYLWTYGPTAFLTVLVAVWNRVEFQSKLVAPWINLSKGPAVAQRTLLLDYISQFQLFAIPASMRHRDFTVSITTTIAAILKVLIIISTGLITLSPTLVSQDSYPMVVQDAFVNSDSRLANAGTLSWYVMQGLLGHNMTLPDGISSDYAFQSVQTDLPSTAETQVTVDGLTSWLDCQPIEVDLTGANPPDPHYSYSTMNFTITSPDCNIENLVLMGPQWTGDNDNTSTTLFARYAPASCDGVSGDVGRRILVMFGNLTYSVDYSRNMTDYTGQEIIHPLVSVLHKSVQMFCIPTYTINRVNVVRNDTKTLSVSPLPDTSNRTLDSVSPWSMMDAHFAAYNNLAQSDGYDYGQSITLSTIPIDVDYYMEVALGSQSVPTPPTSLFESEILEDVANSYYKQFAAVLAKQALMEPASVNITGSATVNENRLVLRLWAAQWMTALVA